MKMYKKVFIAFDFGKKNIGISIGNSLIKKSYPIKIVKNKKNIYLYIIQNILKKWKPNILILGLPISSNGKEQCLTFDCRNFAEYLNNIFNINIILVDERNSNKKNRINMIDDHYASSVILQRYIDLF